MRDSNTERIGVYKSALIITQDIKWIFREQPLVDVGIDALIEEVNIGNPTGKFIAAQIKTGEGNFHSNEKNLTLYVSNIHYNYWLNFNMPVIIIAHLPNTDSTYWQLICEKNLIKTNTRWKINIPMTKILDKNSIGELQRIINGLSQDKFIKEFQVGIVTLNEIQKFKNEFKSLELSTKSIKNISALINSLGAITRNNTIQITAYTDKGLTKQDKLVKLCLKKYSIQINNNVYRLSTEIQDFALYYSIGIRGLEKLIIYNFYINKDISTLEETLDHTIDLNPNLDFAISSIESMSQTISTIPKYNPHIKKAQAKLISICEQIIYELKIAKKINLEFIYNLERLIKH